MSIISHQTVLQQRDTQVQSQERLLYTSFESSFISDQRTATSSPAAVGKGTIITPKVYQFRLFSGSDLKISADGGSTYPFRLSGAGDHTSLRLDVEGLQEITTVTAEADTAGSLGGDYIQFYDRNGTVRPWFNVTARPEISTIQCVADVTDSLDGTYFILYDAAGSVGFWIDTNDSGTTIPAGALAAARAVEITTILTDDTAAAVAVAVQAAINADAAFGATEDGIDTVTVTDVANGARTDLTAGDSGFTVAVTQQGITASADPGGGTRMVQVDIAGDSSAATVAAALVTALTDDDEVTAAAALAVVTITDRHPGTRAAASVGTTGWSSIVSSGTGAAQPSVYMQSLGTTEVIVTVSPN